MARGTTERLIGAAAALVFLGALVAPSVSGFPVSGPSSSGSKLPCPGSPCPGVALSSYLGGTGNDYAWDIALDSSGSIYVVGGTYSSDFPTTPGAYDTTFNGMDDVFVAKFSATGTLVYSTFMGGADIDYGGSIAVDPSGNAYVSGTTWSSDFPTTAGAFDTTRGDGCSQLWGCDGFLAKLSANGTALVYSTFLGGSSSDSVDSVAVDALGEAYVAGRTFSADFPVTPGALDSSFDGGSDAFLTKFDASGSALVYSTFLGGGKGEAAYAMALDPSGNAYVAGGTESTDFPATPGAFDTSFNGGECNCLDQPVDDGFVAKLNAEGTALVYATFLGGSQVDYPWHGIALDADGAVYVTGETGSSDFPTTPGAFDTAKNGFASDAFVTKLKPDGSGLAYSTFLGGHDRDFGYSVALDPDGNAYVTGLTKSFNFPTTPNTFDATIDGGHDAFVTKLNASGDALWYSTFLGGSDQDWGQEIEVDSSGNAYVTGFTAAIDFPTTLGAYDRTWNGGEVEFPIDAYLTKLELVPEPNTAPAASFVVTPLAGFVTTTFFVDASSSSDDHDPSWLLDVRWDWEDDGMWDTSWSAAKGAKHEYATPGAFTMRLEVRDRGGLMASTTREVAVSALPPLAVDISANATLGTVPLTISFSAGPVGGTPPYTFRWDFGDGSTSGEQNPSHTYGAAGPYTVTLTVTDSGGRIVTKTLQVEAKSPLLTAPGTGIPPLVLYAVVAAVGLGIVGLVLWTRRRR